MERLEKLITLYKEKFNESPEDVFSSPGRIELLGNHTDHNHGLVLVSSVNLNILAVAKKNSLHQINFYSDGYPLMQVDLRDLELKEAEFSSSIALIRGVLKKMVDLGYKIGGFNCYCDSTIFKGAGVSSSAAFEVLIAKIESYYFNQDAIPPFTLAEISQFSESVYFNKPCGLLDQSGIALGGINYIDFKNTKKPLIKHINVGMDDYQFILINTGDDHTKLTPCYKAIKDEMKEVANYFNKNVLREVSEEKFYENKENIINKISSRAYLRAKHFFEENKRVEVAFQALKDRNYSLFLSMMEKSGDSSYYQLQNCYVNDESERLPQAIQFTKNLDLSSIVRVHGGGFAGTILMVINKNKILADVPTLEKHFGKKNVMLVSLSKNGTEHVQKL